MFLDTKVKDIMRRLMWAFHAMQRWAEGGLIGKIKWTGGRWEIGKSTYWHIDILTHWLNELGTQNDLVVVLVEIASGSQLALFGPEGPSAAIDVSVRSVWYSWWMWCITGMPWIEICINRYNDSAVLLRHGGDGRAIIGIGQVLLSVQIGLQY